MWLLQPDRHKHGPLLIEMLQDIIPTSNTNIQKIIFAHYRIDRIIKWFQKNIKLFIYGKFNTMDLALICELKIFFWYYLWIGICKEFQERTFIIKQQLIFIQPRILGYNQINVNYFTTLKTTNCYCNQNIASSIILFHCTGVTTRSLICDRTFISCSVCK